MQDLLCPKCGQRVTVKDGLRCPGCDAVMAGHASLPIPVTTTAIAAPLDAARLAERTADDDVPELVPSIRRSWLYFFARPVVVVVGLVAVTAIGVSVPAIQKVREAAHRTTSTQNLRKIGLAAHAFHDANKRLPYNGVSAPVFINGKLCYGPQPAASNFQFGSAFFQISSYLDQQALFNGVDQGGDLPGVDAWMCPGRGRPATWSTGGARATFTADLALGVDITSGPWTDYVLNSYLNANVSWDGFTAGQLNVPDNKRTLVGITDGTNQTIMFGHGQIAVADYGSSTAATGYRDSALHGGSAATAANPHPTAIVMARDPADGVTARNRGWGSPFAQGCLMCMADGMVRMFPYSLNDVSSGVVPATGMSSAGRRGLAQFMTPNAGDNPIIGWDE